MASAQHKPPDVAEEIRRALRDDGSPQHALPARAKAGPANRLRDFAAGDKKRILAPAKKKSQK